MNGQLKVLQFSDEISISSLGATKVEQYDLFNTVIQATGGAANNVPIAGIAQGTDYNNRVGSNLLLKAVSIKLLQYGNMSNTTASGSAIQRSVNAIRVILFKPETETALTSPVLITSRTGITTLPSMYEQFDVNQSIVPLDVLCPFGANDSWGGYTDSVMLNQTIQFDSNNDDSYVHYASGTQTTPLTGRWQLSLVFPELPAFTPGAGNLAPKFVLQCKVFFQDV